MNASGSFLILQPQVPADTQQKNNSDPYADAVDEGLQETEAGAAKGTWVVVRTVWVRREGEDGDYHGYLG
jgi:hypothetical protein